MYWKTIVKIKLRNILQYMMSNCFWKTRAYNAFWWFYQNLFKNITASHIKVLKYSNYTGKLSSLCYEWCDFFYLTKHQIIYTQVFLTEVNGQPYTWSSSIRALIKTATDTNGCQEISHGLQKGSFNATHPGKVSW